MTGAEPAAPTGLLGTTDSASVTIPKLKAINISLLNCFILVLLPAADLEPGPQRLPAFNYQGKSPMLLLPMPSCPGVIVRRISARWPKLRLLAVRRRPDARVSGSPSPPRSRRDTPKRRRQRYLLRCCCWPSGLKRRPGTCCCPRKRARVCLPPENPPSR